MNILTLQKRKLELLTAFFGLAWGLWILNPFWNSFQSSEIFYRMNEVAPEWAWGLAVTFVGLFQMVTLFTNMLRFRALAAVLSVFTFITISGFMVFSNIKNTASPVYLVIAFCAWLGYTEIVADIKEAKCK